MKKNNDVGRPRWRLLHTDRGLYPESPLHG
jgi:hypothetical protein